MRDTDLVEAVRGIVLSILNSRTTEIRDGWLYGQWWSVEASDVNLSIVKMPDGNFLRGVPRSDGIASLTQGDVILMAVPRGGAVCIVCRVIGNAGAFSV